MPLLNTNIVWAPIEHSSQELALAAPCNSILYSGTRGPGKTDTQLMDFHKNVGVGYGPFWKGVLFGKEYKELDDIVTKSKRWFPKFNNGAQFKESKSDYKWVWPSGEELLFRAAATLADYWKYHGQEFPWIGWNEITTYPNLELFDMMMSCNRSSYTPEKDGFLHPSIVPTFVDGIKVPAVNPWTKRLPPPIPLRVFSTTNPWGAGHAAVKRQFIDAAPYGEIVRVKTRVFNPRTKEDEDVERTQISIFGSWRENPYLDPLYIASLINDKDPNRRKAWSTGDWNIIAGGPFDDVYDHKTHVLPWFKVPAGWFVNRSFDWGSSQPASYQLWAEANGEEATFRDGTSFCPPPGTLIQIGELYGGEINGSNVGNRWSARKWAREILAYENAERILGLFEGEVNNGPADNQIRNVNDTDSDTLEKMMQDEGLFWEPSDKSPGSRKVGLQLARDRFWNFKTGEGPGLAFTRQCVASHSTIPMLPRHEKIVDDVMSEGVEDHAWDACRYRVLSGNNRYATVVGGGLPS